MEANTALRSRLKRQFEEDGGSSKAPEEKRIRFPKGKKAKAGEEVIKIVPIGAEEEGPADLADPRVAAKERAKRRSQMTTELLRDEGRANDITAAEVEYEDNTTFVDEGIQIEPFNLKQELEEGYFDADGNFVEYVKDGNQIKDAWLDSVDTVYRENSSYMGNIEKGYDDLSSGDIQKINRRIADVLEPGETFITDNGSNYKAAGAILEKKYPTMFWTPCAAHCCNLMLQDMGEKIPRVKSVLLNARSIVVYIYNHGRVLNLMRKFTKGELHRSCVTRFASQFYTLQSLVHNYDGLRMMFVLETWSKSDYAKKPEGSRIVELVVRDAEFWNDVSFACAIMAPIVDVLRLVDTEEKPCMGYIYEAMDRAKEQIQKNIGEDKAKSIQERTTCREMRCTVWAMIDNRWEFQLHRPLHAAGFYLNPSMFYSQLGSDQSLLLEYNEDIKTGLHRVFDRLAPTTELNQKLYEEVISYREAEKTFGTDAAIRSRLTMTPAARWGSFGSATPNLQKIAIRILSQTCSSSPCERNWSAFNNVPRALRRLKGTTNSKKDKMPAEAKRMFDQLTEDSSKLIENGDQDVYDHKREDFEREAGNDADDFDIFGDDDEKPVADHIGFGATSEPDIQPSSENSHTISESWEGQTDYVYDESSGYYYSSTLGYYYDPTSGLYCSASSGIWYSFNEQTGSYDEIQGEAAVPVSVT